MDVNYIDQLAATIRDAIPPDARPADRAMELYRLYALLVLATGKHTTPRNVHDAWSVWMAAADSEHRSLRPFEDLDIDTQAEDLPYVAAILSVANRYGAT